MTDINWHQRASEATLDVRNFINGQPIDCVGQAINKHSARDGQLLYQFGEGDQETVDTAVSSARNAFNDGRWSSLPNHQRKAVLLKLADLLETNRETFALYECLDVGKPITHALYDDVARAAASLRGSAEKMDQVFSPSGSDAGLFAYQQRKPVGVVGGIIGWNYPLSLAASKVGPALAMGNSLVLKPSEFTSLSAWRLAELAIEAGVPEGVFNVVNGAGKIVGDALARHPDVDLLTFVGSSATGKQMMISAGQSNMKRLLLECGGKSPFIVFDDCPENLDVVAAFIVQQAFLNQGENCKAGSRLLIQSGVKEKLLAKVVEQASQLKPQDPLDPNAHFSALINEAHLNKVLAYIESGKEQGAELILGGNRIDVDTGTSLLGKDDGALSTKGCYVEPTIFDNVDPNSTIAQEEIFGPVLSVITFKDEAEAIQIANNTCFGLQAYAATENLARAQRLGRSLNVGNLMILGSSSPHMGAVSIAGEPQRQSGMGCEMGMAGLLSYSVSTVVDIHA